ncbi:MAG: PemK-like, MazF-like toxin of type toxin-antitoxin system [Segetibacter sp.]|nr:PemK-like, MazF-like toxin of type toxin-antitoxin system [Segetibacter sp.]
MDIRQRDVVYLVDKFNKYPQEHPYIVLSCKDAILHDGLFTAIMLTNAAYDDIYSFHVTNNMFTRALSSEGQVRLHLIASFRDVQVIRNPVSRMKTGDFKRLLKQINETVFSLDED